MQAMQRIEEFNEEEAAFGLELSQYPLRKQIFDKLAPYKKLYDNATGFIDKHELWMKSKVGSYDPEEIDTDVGTCYRNIYKLEKVFTDKPATLNLATTVRVQLKVAIHLSKSQIILLGERTNRSFQRKHADHPNFGQSWNERTTLGESVWNSRISY